MVEGRYGIALSENLLMPHVRRHLARRRDAGFRGGGSGNADRMHDSASTSVSQTLSPSTASPLDRSRHDAGANDGEPTCSPIRHRLGNPLVPRAGPALSISERHA